MHNPFIYRSGVDNEMFFGRKKELNSILSRLSGKKPLCISITGLRRIGKTSILRFINSKQFINEVKQKSKKNYLFIYLDFQKLTNIDDFNFFRYVSQKIFYEIRNQDNINLEITKIIENYVNHLNKSTDKFEIKNEYFETIIKIITQNLKLNIIIICDEFENAMKSLEIETFDFLRAISAEYNISYITATRKELQHICRNADLSGFHNIFSLLKISLFDEVDSRNLLTKPLESLGISINESDIDEILNYTGFHPFFIQLFGYYLVENFNGKDFKIDEVKKTYYLDAKPIFEEIFDSLEEIEKNTLINLVNNEFVEDTLLNSLKEKGLLLDDYSIFSKSFYEFLINNKYTNKNVYEDIETIVWSLIEKVELGLRRLIKQKLFQEYKEEWETKMLESLHINQINGIKERKEKAIKRYAPLDFEPSKELIDYTYIGQLSSIIFSKWELFQNVFGNGKHIKRQLREKLDVIIQIRNDRGHFNRVPKNELKRAEVFCTDIILIINKYEI